MKKLTTAAAALAALILSSCATKPLIPQGDGTDIFAGKTISTSLGQGMAVVYDFDSKGTMTEKTISPMQDSIIATYRYSYSESQQKLYLQAKKYVFEGKEYSEDAAVNFISSKAYEKFVSDMARANQAPEDLIPNIIENYRDREATTIKKLFSGIKTLSVKPQEENSWLICQLEDNISFPDFFTTCAGYFYDLNGFYIADGTFYMYYNSVKISNATENSFVLLPPNSDDLSQAISATYTATGTTQDDIKLNLTMEYQGQTQELSFDYLKKEYLFKDGTPSTLPEDTTTPAATDSINVEPVPAE